MRQRRGAYSAPHCLDHGPGRGKPAPTPAPTLSHLIFKDHKSAHYFSGRGKPATMKTTLSAACARR